MNISPADVDTVLSSAENLNAALKTLLKREGRPGNSIEPFAKSLRAVVSRRREGELLKYIESNYEARSVHFALLASYAFPQIRDTVGEKVVTRYADVFNATYEKIDGGIRITDKAKFQSIVSEVVEIVKSDLTQAGVPSNNFSIYAFLATIFEPEVFEEVLKTME